MSNLLSNQSVIYHFIPKDEMWCACNNKWKDGFKFFNHLKQKHIGVIQEFIEKGYLTERRNS